MVSRRSILAGSAAAAALAAMGGALWVSGTTQAAAAGEFPVDLSPEEWRERLTPAQFAVLREEDTERPYSSPLDKLFQDGTYACAGCSNEVYSSEAKYDSGTGWPSFWQPLGADAVGTRTDYKLLYPRTEVHCADCGGHLGHIFNDGPSPTNQRHCLNGVALTFTAA